jgi:hypothetical protein
VQKMTDEFVEIVVSEHEWYPCYEFAVGEEPVCTETKARIPREKYEWLKRVRDEHDEANRYLSELFYQGRGRLR